ncbi:MAG: TolC family protein [Legionellales bacterium]|jgi:outer membrane protein|nr:TolC family protein [Legionellales bacterium]
MKKNLLLFGLICSVSHGGSLEKGCLNALGNDNAYKAAQAGRSATLKQQDITQDALKPQLTSHASLAQERFTANPDNSSKLSDTFVSQNINIELKQALIDLKSYRTYKKAEIITSKADTDLVLAKQNLILNVAEKYLDVLEKHAIYRASASQSQALLVQKKHDSSKFKAGSITKTDLLETSAKYDSAIAHEISAQNKLLDARDEYKETTKEINPVFMALNPKNNPKKLSKTTIDEKMQIMQAGNLNLKSSFLNSLSIKKEIDIQEAGHLPTLNISGSYNNKHNPNSVLSSYAPTNDTETKSIGLDIQVPIYEGGAVNDEIEKSQYKYKQAAEELEQTRSNLIIEMRKNNHYLISGIKQINALKNAVISSKSALAAQKAGYEAGTRTNLELLSSISQLQESESQYAIARYDYLKNQLREKQLVGSLNISDIKNLDALLTNKISISEQAP